MATPTGALGAKLFVHPTALINITDAADTLADFKALFDSVTAPLPVEIGLIENFGEMGRQFDVVPFQAVADGRTWKLKGGYNDGQMTLVVGQDLSDAGQFHMKTVAEASNQNTYPFKMTIVGAATTFDTYYWGAKVTSWRINVGAVNNTIRATAMMEVDTSIFVGAA